MNNDNFKSMVPRMVRKGLIECPKCGWKQSDENEQCPMCDLIFPKLNKFIDNTQHKEYSKFKLNKLIIKAPSNYIHRSERIKLKQNKGFFELITNLDKLDFNPRDIIKHFEEIISIANEKFLSNEGVILKQEFKNDLKNHEGLITDLDKEKFKEKYNKRYCNYYRDLNFDYLIEEHNEKIINNEKEIYQNDFIKKLSDCKHIISDSEREKFKIEYNKDYCQFYDVLGFDELINDFNNDIIKKEKLKIVADLKEGYISQSEKIAMEKELDFDLDDIVDEHNEEYIKKQMGLYRHYFENIAGTSLDNDQIRAVLTDDDYTQIVAGAGTGKTLTLQAKVKYLIEKQGVVPEDILCISFSNSARDDLAKKLEKTLGNNNVDVRTFHSIGYHILGINGEDREVPEQELIDLVDGYFKEFVNGEPEFLKDIIEFFCYYFNMIYINESNFNFQTIRSKLNELDEYEEYLKEYLNIQQLDDRKEYMKSFPELIVANYLFIHNISYEYSINLKYKEKNYDKFISTYNRLLFGSEYKNIPDNIKLDFINEFDRDFGFKLVDCYPNFYLPDYDIFIELLSTNKDWEIQCDEESKEKLKKQFDLRDKFNNSHDTKLISIFNYDGDVENFLTDIETHLLENGVTIDLINYKTLFDLLIIENNLQEYKSFIKTVERFINIFKGNSENVDYEGNDISKLKFDQYIKENKIKYDKSLKKRNELFLKFIAKIFEIYSDKIKLNNFIDFNDMINDAVIALRNGAYIHNYKYIIVDEYQDTSHTRYNLLKEMQKSTGAKLIVVGDDWQSIYGFTGCDVGLFSDFEKYFDNPKMVKIQITHRNSQQLIDVVGKFIQKNKKQIPKKLKSDDVLTKKPIKLVGCMSKADKVLSLMNILDEISQKQNNAKILILGRNNKDIREISCKEIFTFYEGNDSTKIIYEDNPNLKIEFRTVHKSKGLESDYVVVLNLTDKINGFPNKMVNDPILDFVINEINEDIDFPEERRLFYVALTRTGNDAFLFYNDNRPSVFINEIKDNKNVQTLNFVFSNEEILRINSLLDKKYEVIETDNICPKCNVGNVNLIVNNEKGTSYFKCSNFCGWDGGSYHNSEYGEGSRKLSYLNYSKVCDECGGMLIVKSQRNNPDIKFLGCNFYKKRGCRNTESIYYLDETSDSIYDLNKTSNDVHYLYKYIPKDKRKEYDDKNLVITDLILTYKDDYDENIISLFTKELVKNISLLINKVINTETDEIAIVAVPPSKVSKKNKSSIKKSINIIENWYEKGILESNFGIKNKIINCKDLLIRIKDVPTAHLGEGRADCEEHVKSIECDYKQLSNNTVYLILDDITTTGASMNACKQILINNDVEEENIYTLAIGATVRGKNEKTIRDIILKKS